MKKKTNKDQQENYLERKPKRHEAIAWAKDEKGIVTLDIENTGFFNRLAQKFFHKPKVTHIHLDEMGSFVWPIMDGEKDIIAIGKEVEVRSVARIKLPTDLILCLRPPNRRSMHPQRSSAPP